MTPINIILIDMSIYKSLILKFIATLVFFNYVDSINIYFHKLTQDAISFSSSTQLIFINHIIQQFSR